MELKEVTIKQSDNTSSSSVMPKNMKQRPDKLPVCICTKWYHVAAVWIYSTADDKGEEKRILL